MKFRLEFNVIDVNPDKSRFALTLYNLSESRLDNWQLAFTATRWVEASSLSQGEINQIGNLCTFKNNKPLEANGNLYVEFEMGTKPFTLQDDGVADACLHATVQGKPHIYPVVITPTAIGERSAAKVPLSLPPEKTVNLIPRPVAMLEKAGSFALIETSAIVAQSEAAIAAASWLGDELSQHTGFDICLAVRGNITFEIDHSQPAGGYLLHIGHQEVCLQASDAEGFFNGAASLLQLVPATPSHNHIAAYQLPCLVVEDYARYRYRGMMLDCARHFHPLRRVKNLINQLAKLKFNYFHWHLTDDEGWRIEIDAYPELTAIGAWRGPFETLEPQYSSLNQTHGGYYSKEQIRDVVAYASARGITVIPEIDIPGHCRAAIKSLPDLLVEPEDKSVYRSIQNFDDNVLNPGLPGTYTFLEKVLDEVCELFPGLYVHIGADEVPKNVWTESPACKSMMARHGYNDVVELQGHLLRHAENHLKQKGKVMYGWEEAVYGEKVSTDTVIFAWQNEQAGLDCIRQGFDVVLQPGHETYLDMAQDFNAGEPGVDWACRISLEKAYHYQPLSKVDATVEEHSKVLGIQCALWCELVDTNSRLEYMIYPRIYAIAEVCWSPKEQRDWPDFQARLNGQLKHLDRQGINYRR